MSSFLKHAEEIFETAALGGRDDCSTEILIGGEGQIRMLADSEWDLDCLRRHHGATEAYRVTRHAGWVCLEGHAVGQSCVFRRELPAQLVG